MFTICWVTAPDLVGQEPLEDGSVVSTLLTLTAQPALASSSKKIPHARSADLAKGGSRAGLPDRL